MPSIEQHPQRRMRFAATSFQARVKFERVDQSSGTTA